MSFPLKTGFPCGLDYTSRLSGRSSRGGKGGKKELGFPPRRNFHAIFRSSITYAGGLKKTVFLCSQ
jgi:hypothetical protein